MENYINAELFDKNMNFCILVVHDLTNDISYDVNLNRSNKCYFGGKIVKFCGKKARIGNIFVIVVVNWLFNVTINGISVIYVTAHRCAGGLKTKLDLRSGS